MELTELLRVSEVAARLGLRRSRTYQLVDQGLIPAVRIGRSIRVPARAFEKWLEECSVKALKECERPTSRRANAV